MATLHEYRINAGLSKRELCKRAGIDIQTLTKAENGEPIFEHKAQLIVNALGAALGEKITIKDLEGINIYQPNSRKAETKRQFKKPGLS